MTWDQRYLPPDNKLWSGRSDIPEGSCYFQVMHLLNLLGQIPPINTKLSFGLLGFCCDEGIRRNFGRTGAVEGPFAIREALARLSLQRKDIICYDAGDIICPDGHLEQSQHALSHAVGLLLDHHIIPLLLGGGHEMAWGHFQAIAKKFPTENIGIVNFDSHFDIRPLPANKQGTSGTPFLQIALLQQQQKRKFNYHCMGIQNAANINSLFQTAKEMQIHFMTASEMNTGDELHSVQFIEKASRENDLLYVSICMDVFATAYAPGVSAPQVLGLTPWQVIPYLRKLACSGKVKSYDIAELSPKYDVDQRTAKLAANLISEIIHHHV